MNSRYPAVADRAGHRCEYCHAPEAIFNSAFEVEHIVPPRHAGRDVGANLALSCRSCNLHKRDRLDGIDPDTEETVPLFHPRRDRWSDHFRADAATSMVVGSTPTGRATVARLRMNAPYQVAARRQWVRLGLFP